LYSSQETHRHHYCTIGGAGQTQEAPSLLSGLSAGCSSARAGGLAQARMVGEGCLHWPSLSLQGEADENHWGLQRGLQEILHMAGSPADHACFFCWTPRLHTGNKTIYPGVWRYLSTTILHHKELRRDCSRLNRQKDAEGNRIDVPQNAAAPRFRTGEECRSGARDPDNLLGTDDEESEG
jgi:hypothetical protein